jgi:hypothetical protein
MESRLTLFLAQKSERSRSLLPTLLGTLWKVSSVWSITTRVFTIRSTSSASSKSRGWVFWVRCGGVTNAWTHSPFTISIRSRPVKHCLGKAMQTTHYIIGLLHQNTLNPVCIGPNVAMADLPTINSINPRFKS